MSDLAARIAQLESERDELIRLNADLDFAMRRLQATYIEAKKRVSKLTTELEDCKREKLEVAANVVRQRQLRSEAQAHLITAKEKISLQNDLIDAVLDEQNGPVKRALFRGGERSKSLEALRTYAAERNK